MADDKAPQPTGDGGVKKNGRHDVVTHRILVGSLGAIVLFTGLNITVLQCQGREPSQALANLGAVALGALVMMLHAIMRPH